MELLTKSKNLHSRKIMLGSIVVMLMLGQQVKAVGNLFHEPDACHSFPAVWGWLLGCDLPHCGNNLLIFFATAGFNWHRVDRCHITNTLV
jgi:hypothetical protein